MLRCLTLVLIPFLISACVIRQEVNPYDYTQSEEICIIEDEAVRTGFLVQLQKSLRTRGIDFRVIEPDASINSCPITLTYNARWSWDLTIYMTLAEIKIYRNGALVGDALYDARRGGGRVVKKFIDAEDKIEELVQELFSGSADEA